MGEGVAPLTARPEPFHQSTYRRPDSARKELDLDHVQHVRRGTEGLQNGTRATGMAICPKRLTSAFPPVHNCHYHSALDRWVRKVGVYYAQTDFDGSLKIRTGSTVYVTPREVKVFADRPT